MRDDFLDAMDGLKGGSDYTLEEIEAAERRKKKKGGSLMENLIEITGRQPSVSAGLPALDTAARDTAALEEEIQALSRSLARDFGVGSSGRERGTAGAAQPGSAAQAGSAASPGGVQLLGSTPQAAAGSATQGVSASAQSERAAQPELLEGERALDAFVGVAEELGKKVYGQEEFLRRLIIALKRPYVMPPEGTRANNAILLIGEDDTGKRYALAELAAILKKRRVLREGSVRTVDLGIYTDASMEKVFLQDIYAALSSASELLLFERYELCHPSYLTMIAALVTDGAFRLSERYVLQNGQLVSVQNSLASETVGTLSAKGKYLVFVTEKGVEKTAGLLGAAFIDALGDICETAPLSEEALREIAQRELEELKQKARERFFFEVSYAEGFLEECVRRSDRQAGLKGIRAFLDSILQALAQARLEGDYPKGAELCICVSEGRLSAASGERTIDLQGYLPEQYRGEVETIRRELDEIVGLREIKEYVLGLEGYYRVQQRRAEEGLRTGEVSKHMIFTGNPGTGKTTIARIISRYLKAIGVLSGGQLVEVSRADLVGRYVGHTAPLTEKVIRSALGGVLFIDEAYSLYRGGEDSFGLEAIDTLVKGIEDHRDDLIVILAGYSLEMEEFLRSNSGLKSRFPNVIHFPDYTGEELLQIAHSIAKSKGYTIEPEADAALCAYFEQVQAVRAADAGNGRLARNLVEEAILEQSRRLVAEPDAELSTLKAADFVLEEDA